MRLVGRCNGRISLTRPYVIALVIVSWVCVFYITKDYLTQKLKMEYSTVLIIYAITPTYTRPTQMADMTRLAQTLMLVPSLHWIVVEDANQSSQHVSELLTRSKMPHTHLFAKTPIEKEDRKFGRGVTTRLEALRWLRDRNQSEGVIYFADDDNAYDIRIFEEMRWTQKVSVWPVGLIEALGISTPVVSDGKVIGFHDPFDGRRQFLVDMAGFAVSMDLWLRSPNATFPYELGYLEDYFLVGLNISIDEMEPKAKNCTEVLVWHSKTVDVVAPSVSNMKKVANYSRTNLPELYEHLTSKRVMRQSKKKLL